MRAILGDYFGGSPLMALPVAALIIFILVFMIAAFRVWRRGAAAYDRLARLPLEDRHE